MPVVPALHAAYEQQMRLRARKVQGMSLTFKSFFTGIAGFDLGFERAGMQCIEQCEKDKAATSILARHYPNVKRYGDIKDVSGIRNSTDVICGGFPCQDVSIAGQRKGLAGERTGLWFEFARVIDETRPLWVVGENVPGILSSNDGRDFAVIISQLVKFGYGVCWRVLDSKYFGVPQERRRVFIVASLGNGAAAKVLFERESQREIRPILPKTYTGTILTKYSNRWDDSETIVRDVDGDRWLSPTECERLQGFPDNWTSGQAKSARYKQLGNAVNVLVAEWIGKRIVQATM